MIACVSVANHKLLKANAKDEKYMTIKVKYHASAKAIKNFNHSLLEIARDNAYVYLSN